MYKLSPAENVTILVMSPPEIVTAMNCHCYKLSPTEYVTYSSVPNRVIWVRLLFFEKQFFSYALIRDPTIFDTYLQVLQLFESLKVSY